MEFIECSLQKVGKEVTMLPVEVLRTLCMYDSLSSSWMDDYAFLKPLTSDKWSLKQQANQP